MSTPRTPAPRWAAGIAVVPSPQPRSRTFCPLVMPIRSTSASPLSRIVSAMRVKSPFSQSALLGFVDVFIDRLRHCVRSVRLQPDLLLTNLESLAGVEALAVAAHCQHPDCRRRSILHRPSGHRHLRADGKLAPADAGALQRARAFRLESPGRDLAGLVLDVDEQPRMRVAVLEFLDDAFDGDRLRLLEHRRGMMRVRGGGDEEERAKKRGEGWRA